MKRIYLFITILFCANLISIAQNRQSAKITPAWVKRTPKRINSNQRFVVVFDQSSSLDEIENNRYINLENYLEKEIQTQGEINTNMHDQSSHIYMNFLTSLRGGKYYPIHIDEYWELTTYGIYQHYYLYSISSNNNMYDAGDITITDQYGVQGLWRSAIVPGWGQMYKGSTIKGIAMLGGTVAFAGGIIGTESSRKSYLNKINQTHDINLIRDYAKKTDQMANIRNVCIGGVIAVYVYNIIDAIVAPGARQVVVKRKKLNDFSLVPTASQDYMGATLTYKF